MSDQRGEVGGGEDGNVKLRDFFFLRECPMEKAKGGKD